MINYGNILCLWTSLLKLNNAHAIKWSGKTTNIWTPRPYPSSTTLMKHDLSILKVTTHFLASFPATHSSATLSSSVKSPKYFTNKITGMITRLILM